MGLIHRYINQTRKPEGVLGKLMLKGMNAGHAQMADWGMARLEGVSPKAAVDLGCGGGRNAAVLLRQYPNAAVTAIDASPLSVEQATAYNRAEIAAGRCTVQQGDVAALPLAGEAFDLATAFETVYFWPGLVRCFAEVARILKPGGRFLIVNESDGLDEAGKKFEKMIDGMKVYTADELEAALKGVGFSIVKSDRHPKKPWIAILAKKDLP